MVCDKVVCDKVVCGGGGGDEEEEEQDTESKTRTPHKDVGNKTYKYIMIDMHK